MIDLTAIIQQINDQVDGHALARLIDYHPDKIQVTGNILKCFCPVHNERAFRSLIFDLKNKSFKCMMKHCACFDGGSFVHFWAIYRQLEPINAARDLVDRLQLSIDLSTLRQLAENYATEAQAALEVGDLTTAREKVDEALAVDPRNAELRLLSAQVWHEAGEVEKALAERLAELAAAGEPTHAIDALNEASALEPDNTALMARLCELHEATGQATELQDTLQRWAAACERLGEQHSLLQVLERLAVLNPHDYSLPERIAHLQAELGSPEQARELWLNLANAHTAAGRYNEALTIIAKLTAATPDDVDLREQRARLLQQTGRAAEAIAAWRELAGLAREVGLNDRVNEYYDQARAIDPGDPGLREDQAAWKLACGDVEGGLAELFALAELFLENGDLPQGMTVLERIVMLAPTSRDW
jgi:tetratricopeptide (TPR) repeat protein